MCTHAGRSLASMRAFTQCRVWANHALRPVLQQRPCEPRARRAAPARRAPRRRSARWCCGCAPSCARPAACTPCWSAWRRGRRTCSRIAPATRCATARRALLPTLTPLGAAVGVAGVHAADSLQSLPPACSVCAGCSQWVQSTLPSGVLRRRGAVGRVEPTGRKAHDNMLSQLLLGGIHPMHMWCNVVRRGWQSGDSGMMLTCRRAWRGCPSCRCRPTAPQGLCGRCHRARTTVLGCAAAPLHRSLTGQRALASSVKQE